MKKLYWRPQRTSARVLLILAAAAAVGLVSVETFRVREVQPFFKEKTEASRLALQAFNAVKKERIRRGIAIDPESDPLQSGLIGQLLSPVTTSTGHLPAKQTTINPNFAAVIVHLLRRAGVNPGDGVAVGLSGSFPALNITVLAALQTLRARALVISSAGASQWGANHPAFMWPDMESTLYRARLISFRSIAVSPGGIDDRALGLGRSGKDLIQQAINRNGLTPLDVKNYVDGLERRMALYRERSSELEIKAYINVGGGTASVGTHVGKKQFKPGLNLERPAGAELVDSVMLRFAERGVPVVHLSNLETLAKQYGLPTEPKGIPPVGQGSVFVKAEYNRWVALTGLIAIFAAMLAFIRTDVGSRILRSAALRKDRANQPQQMV